MKGISVKRKETGMKVIMTFLISIMATAYAPAQHRYYLAVKGDKVEYDTAVVIRASAFRKDLQTLRKQKAMIDSLQDLNALYAERNQETIMVKQIQEESIDKFITDLNENPPRREKSKWYMNPVLGIGVGILIGVYLIQ